MILNIDDIKIQDITAALTHSSMSTHHRACSVKKTMHCSCHVAKSANALGIFQAAVQAASSAAKP